MNERDDECALNRKNFYMFKTARSLNKQRSRQNIERLFTYNFLLINFSMQMNKNLVTHNNNSHLQHFYFLRNQHQNNKKMQQFISMS